MGFALLAVGGSPWGLAGLGGALVLSTAGVMALRWPEGRKTPRVLAVCGFVFATHLAGALAWIKALRGERNPIWEPTRRPV